MRINHNIAALNTYRQLNSATNAQTKSMEKLASGLRINRAGDDAAGLAISEKMRGQIRGLDQANRNAQDGISLIQTAEGALNETHSILQRMRELAVQSSNDTATDADRSEIQKEVSQLKSEIDRIRDTTEFNTKKLLNGSVGINTSLDATNAAKIQGVTVNNDTLIDDQYKISTVAANDITTTTSLENSSIAGFTAAASNFDLTDTKTDNLDFGTYTLESKMNTATNFDLALKDANGKVVASVNGVDWQNQDIKLTGAGGVSLTLKQNSTAGSGEATFSIEAKFANNNTTIKANNGLGATLWTSAGNETTKNGEINTGDFTIKLNIESVQASSAGGVNSSITVNNNAMNFQIGANEGQTTKLAISDMSTTKLGVNNVDVSTLSGAQAAITSIDSAIQKVSSERSKLGANQNRLEHTINNLGTSAENLTAAESRVRDVDMAKEMMEQTKNSILSQAAQAMLAQSNQVPNGVLQLLR
ncbi:flagellin [Fictibacillus gelatini]|uniref:flagellin N-terminal helical domain-containing protein n=1 Tax=Fictibacillus gelatini TaxID=225985 RepID=UPI000410334F|nr:flagellin [Fictibacillus gelatini]